MTTKRADQQNLPTVQVRLVAQLLLLLLFIPNRSAERLLAFESRAKLASIQVEAAHQIKVTSWQVQANSSLRVGVGKEPQSKATETSAPMVAAASASKEAQQLFLPKIDPAELTAIRHADFPKFGTHGKVDLFSWQGIEIALKCAHDGKTNLEEAQAFIDDEIKSFEKLQKGELCSGVVHALGTVKLGDADATCLALEYVEGEGLNGKGNANILNAASQKNIDLGDVVKQILKSLEATGGCIKSKGIPLHVGNTGNVIIPKKPDVLLARGMLWIDMHTRGIVANTHYGPYSDKTSIDGNVAYFTKLLCETQKLPCL